MHGTARHFASLLDKLDQLLGYDWLAIFSSGLTFGLTKRRRENLPNIGVFRLWEKIKVPRRNPHWQKEHMQTP